MAIYHQSQELFLCGLVPFHVAALSEQVIHHFGKAHVKELLDEVDGVTALLVGMMEPLIAAYGHTVMTLPSPLAAGADGLRDAGLSFLGICTLFVPVNLLYNTFLPCNEPKVTNILSSLINPTESPTINSSSQNPNR